MSFLSGKTGPGLNLAFLVLHGGSGLSDADFEKAIASGISKVNIFTDINLAGASAAARAYREGKGLTDLVEPTVEAVKTEVMKKINLFQAAGKA